MLHCHSIKVQEVIMIDKRERSNINIQHNYYKPKKWKRIANLKNIALFGLYLGGVVLIVELADGKNLKEAYAKNLSITKIEKNIATNDIINEDSLTLTEKLKLNFYAEYIGNRDIAKYTLKHSKAFDIEPSLLIALMKVESRFNVYAVNYNKNRSIDRGICQLNSNTFTKLKAEDFFNPDVNIMNGAKLLRWCLDKADNKLTKALALYNAGFGKVSATKVGAITLDYIQKIVDEKEIIDGGFQKYLEEYSDLLD